MGPPCPSPLANRAAAYADGFDPERLTAAMRGLIAKTYAEARELAIAQQLPA